MSNLISYNDFGNMYHIQTAETLYCYNNISKKVMYYTECLFDNDRFILVFTFDDYILPRPSCGVILDKTQQVEWKLNTIGTDDLFDIDSWYRIKIYSDEKTPSAFISLKKIKLENIQKYKFQENFYRE